MSGERLHWSDAIRARDGLRGRPGDRSLLFLLTRLPLVPERVIEQLEGLRGGASVYRRLSQLAEQRLLAAIQPSLRPGHEAHLWYLTDLGLAVVALDQGCDLGDLVRRNRLRRADLASRLSGLPQLLAAYEILGALATSQPGRPDLLAWERPWHRRVWTRLAKAPRSVRFPAYAALAWDGQAGEFILVPDLATIPLRFYVAAIRGLFLLRATASRVPIVIVATTGHERKTAWGELLEDVRQERAEAPLTASILTWTEARNGALTQMIVLTEDNRSHRSFVRRIAVRPASQQRARGAIPRIVGPELGVSESAESEDVRIAVLGLGTLGRMLLDFVGRHPFLSIDQLAIALGRTVAIIRNSVGDAVAAGFMRTLDVEEARQRAGDPPLLELTTAGQELVAAQQGLSLAEAVRFNGLAGGGPDHPAGARSQLLRQLAHTRGADDVFIRLIALACKRARNGSDDALVEWCNAAACARGRVRPDGYGLYRNEDCLYGFFLEFDRGTMGAHDYVAKLNAYADYLTSGRFARDYVGFPTVLVVAADNAAEERFARAARLAAIGRPSQLPILLTTMSRVENPSNSLDLLGQIWRSPMVRSQRRRWIETIKESFSDRGNDEFTERISSTFPDQLLLRKS